MYRFLLASNSVLSVFALWAISCSTYIASAGIATTQYNSAEVDDTIHASTVYIGLGALLIGWWVDMFKHIDIRHERVRQAIMDVNAQMDILRIEMTSIKLGVDLDVMFDGIKDRLAVILATAIEPSDAQMFIIETIGDVFRVVKPHITSAPWRASMITSKLNDVQHTLQEFRTQAFVNQESENVVIVVMSTTLMVGTNPMFRVLANHGAFDPFSPQYALFSVCLGFVVALCNVYLVRANFCLQHYRRQYMHLHANHRAVREKSGAVPTSLFTSGRPFHR